MYLHTDKLIRPRFFLPTLTIDFEFISKLSALVFLLHPSGSVFTVVGTRIACFLVLILPRMYASSKIWFFVFFLLFFNCIDNYTTIDNHKWLYSYWCLSLFIASLCDTTQHTPYLSRMASLLIGTCMLLAVVYKAVISRDFTNGAFFEFTLMSDARFAGLANFFGDIFPELANRNREIIRDALHQLGPTTTSHDFHLTTHPLLHDAAKIITWWTLFIETLIGLTFLLLSPRHIAKHILLLVFILTTYPIAPVIGFASILAIMGLSHASAGPSWLKLAYLALLIGFPIFHFTSRYLAHSV